MYIQHNIKCHTQDNTDTRGNPTERINRYHERLLLWSRNRRVSVIKEFNQSYSIQSNWVYSTMIRYNITILPLRSFCVTKSSVDVCYIHWI